MSSNSFCFLYRTAQGRLRPHRGHGARVDVRLGVDDRGFDLRAALRHLQPAQVPDPPANHGQMEASLHVHRPGDGPFPVLQHPNVHQLAG